VDRHSIQLVPQNYGWRFTRRLKLQPHEGGTVRYSNATTDIEYNFHGVGAGKKALPAAPDFDHLRAKLRPATKGPDLLR